MTKEEFNEKLEHIIESDKTQYGGDFLVLFKAKYKWDKVYDEYNEILSVSGEFCFEWLHDWYEGQHDYILEDVIRIDTIAENYRNYSSC